MHDKPDANITLHLVWLKMELDKEYVCHCLLFCVHLMLMHNYLWVIYETYGENVIAIRTYVNWFKWFKSSDFNINY